MPTARPARKLGVFSLVMITAGSVDSIRNLPASALLGTEMIIVYVIAALIFFLPAAFISAELASNLKQRSGIYSWVKAAFGPQCGVLAVWLQWTENIIWYPTILAFVAATAGYIISPSLIHSRLFICSVIIIGFWLITLINLCGITMSAVVASVCTLAGLILPMVAIMVLGLIWWLSGHPLQLNFNEYTLLSPDHTHTTWLSLTAVVLSLMGIEIATVHSNEVHNPKHAYPRAILISGVILLITLLGGALAIGIVVPHHALNPLYGIIQVFIVFFQSYHLTWLITPLVITIVIGVIGSVNNWVVAPTSGLRYAAKDQNLPMIFADSNINNAPRFLLLLQAVIVSVISLCFALLPSVTTTYWFLTAAATQQYSLMYILMFAAGIKQRYNRTSHECGYTIPGGKIVIWLLGGLGITSMCFIIGIGFTPPPTYTQDSPLQYELLLSGLLLLLILPAFVLYHFNKKKINNSLSNRL